MNPLIMIPARMAATRLPNKPLADIGGKPMIVRAWEQAALSGFRVAVAAGDPEIVEVVEAAGGLAVLTDPGLPSGSDRIRAAVEAVDPDGAHDLVINIQGDMPFASPDLARACADLLARAGFAGDQVHELQWHRIRWPLMSQEEADRRELNTLLNDLERQQLYCNREQLTEIVFSPVRKPGERWTERLQWLLMTDGFGFRSPLSREAGARALAILAGYTGREVTEHLATVMVWNDAGTGERP